MKKLILLTLILVQFGCSASKEEAVVSRIDGLYIYVYSTPKVAFEVLGEIENDVFSQLDENLKGKKKFDQILQGIVKTSSDNISFDILLSNMIIKAKQNYADAEGIIFNHNMSNARVIRFSY